MQSTPTRSVAVAGEAADVTEIADNHAGSPVFKDPQGRAVDAGVPSTIPFGTPVLVHCKTGNASAMTSVHAFYLIDTPPWKGVYGVADTFTNGDPLGSSGGHLVDAAVPDCL